MFAITKDDESEIRVYDKMSIRIEYMMIKMIMNRKQQEMLTITMTMVMIIMILTMHMTIVVIQ